MSETDIRADAVLDPSIQFEQAFSDNKALAPYFTNLYKVKDPQAVFLTGVIGALGINLLSELLKQTSASVYCLVRGGTVQDWKNWLKGQLDYYGYWDEAFDQRILPVVGNLQLPLFGLDEAEFGRLAAKLNVVFHNGATFNPVQPYSVLKPANVSGTLEAIRLAAMAKTKPLHFVSTSDVFLSHPYFKRRPIKESEMPQWSATLQGGYAQSKWVAEQLVHAAQQRGMPACIYRPGNILGYITGGASYYMDDTLSGLVRACILVKQYPAANTVVTLTPVDYISQALVHLSLQPGSLGKAFNMVNSQPMAYREFFASFNSLGYALEEVDFDVWRDAISQRLQVETDESLRYLLSAMESINPPEVLFSGAKYVQFDTSQTVAILEKAAIRCPPLDEDLLATFLTHEGILPDGVVCRTDLAYARPASGTDPNLLSLDYYALQGRQNAPVLIFIHGGGWIGGDKSNAKGSAMVKVFVENGFVFIAANTRLVASRKSPGATYAEQASDIASTVRWVKDHAQEIGGDPMRISLMGYSSGAHLVSLVATDGRYLAEHGMQPSDLAGVIALDVDAYDIPRSIEESSQLGYGYAADNLKRVFGPAQAQKDASPLFHVKRGNRYPPLLIISVGIMDSQKEMRHDLSNQQSEVFAKALRDVPTEAKHLHLPHKMHKQLLTGFNNPNDEVRAAVLDFAAK